MSPLRRPIAVVGLLGVLLTAWMTAAGQIGLAEAGLRATVLLLFVRVLDKGSTWGLRQAAGAAARVSSRGQIVTRPEGEELAPPA